MSAEKTKKSAKATKSASADINVRALSAHSRYTIGNNGLDLCAGIKRQLSLVNEQAMRAPVAIEIDAPKHHTVILPHPASMARQRIQPEVGVAMLPPGKHKLEQIVIRNKNVTAQYLNPEDPIAHLVFIKAEPLSISSEPFPEED